MLYNALDTGKVTGSKVVNSFPFSDPVFPAVILPMANINFGDPLTIDGSTRELPVTVELEFYVEQEDKQTKLAEIIDAASDSFDTMSEDNIEFLGYETSNVSKVEVNQQLFYSAGMVARFKLVS